jgi:uncharacterized protein with GYD domain
MATYVLLLTLTPEGREMELADPEHIRRAEERCATPGVQILGLYGVLGQYDFVGIIEAPDNDAAARFSLKLGVEAGVAVTSMPAIPVGRLEPLHNVEAGERPAEATFSGSDFGGRNLGGGDIPPRNPPLPT